MSKNKIKWTVIYLIGILLLGIFFVYVYEKSQGKVGSQQTPVGSARYFSNDLPGSETVAAEGSASWGQYLLWLNGKNTEYAGKVRSREPAKPMMGRLANETLRAELGRAAWRLLHTMCGRFPLHPSLQQQQSLHDYIYLFAELYPCGDCAQHFQAILKSYPPDVSSRELVANWACFVHNKVNTRLNKPLHNCSNILLEYDCGCGSEEES